METFVVVDTALGALAVTDALTGAILLWTGEYCAEIGDLTVSDGTVFFSAGLTTVLDTFIGLEVFTSCALGDSGDCWVLCVIDVGDKTVFSGDFFLCRDLLGDTLPEITDCLSGPLVGDFSGDLRTDEG